jgi:RimJ/RimL family protein N-acetyltransferase
MILRPATLDDAQFLFELRNEDSNRSMFKDTSKVEWGNHIAWLLEKISCSDFFIYIALDENENKLGQFRIDPKGEVSVSLAERFKGKGLGWQIIKLGSEEFKKSSSKELVAEIKSENKSSLKAFEKAGYQFKRKFKDKDQEYLLLCF